MIYQGSIERLVLEDLLVLELRDYAGLSEFPIGVWTVKLYDSQYEEAKVRLATCQHLEITQENRFAGGTNVVLRFTQPPRIAYGAEPSALEAENARLRAAGRKMAENAKNHYYSHCVVCEKEEGHEEDCPVRVFGDLYTVTVTSVDGTVKSYPNVSASEVDDIRKTLDGSYTHAQYIYPNRDVRILASQVRDVVYTEEV